MVLRLTDGFGFSVLHKYSFKTARVFFKTAVVFFKTAADFFKTTAVFAETPDDSKNAPKVLQNTAFACINIHFVVYLCVFAFRRLSSVSQKSSVSL